MVVKMFNNTGQENTHTYEFGLMKKLLTAALKLLPILVDDNSSTKLVKFFS